MYDENEEFDRAAEQKSDSPTSSAISMAMKPVVGSHCSPTAAQRSRAMTKSGRVWLSYMIFPTHSRFRKASSLCSLHEKPISLQTLSLVERPAAPPGRRVGNRDPFSRWPAIEW